MAASSHTYDVFISHKSDAKPWVEVLARNLHALPCPERCGLFIPCCLDWLLAVVRVCTTCDYIVIPWSLDSLPPRQA